MNVKIILKPEDVWQYYVDHTDELREHMKLIAFSPDFDTEIQISEDGDLLTAHVYLNDQEIAAEEMINAFDTKSSIEKMYKEYIYNAEEFVEQWKLQQGEDEEEDLIETRELELDDAAYEFLVSILGEAFDVHSKETQEILEDVKDCVLPMLYEKHGIEVYRPMYIADDNGNEEFCLYPYSEITEVQGE